MIEQAHEHGIRCNVFWSDDPEEAAGFLRDGVDTVLSDNSWQMPGSSIRGASDHET